MDKNQLNEYLLAKRETTLSHPFGDDVSVYKVNNKMFALIGYHHDMLMINLKCDPDEGAALCDMYSGITPGYHMDKRHWISVYNDNSVAHSELERLIDNSYVLVVKKMTKPDQQRLLT